MASLFFGCGAVISTRVRHRQNRRNSLPLLLTNKSTQSRPTTPSQDSRKSRQTTPSRQTSSSSAIDGLSAKEFMQIGARPLHTSQPLPGHIVSMDKAPPTPNSPQDTGGRRGSLAGGPRKQELRDGENHDEISEGRRGRGMTRKADVFLTGIGAQDDEFMRAHGIAYKDYGI